MTEQRDFDAERRRILRRVSLLTWGLWGAVVFLALAGGAILAWIFRGVGGLSFLALWLISTLVLLVVPGAVHVVMRATGRRGDGRGGEP